MGTERVAVVRTHLSDFRIIIMLRLAVFAMVIAVSLAVPVAVHPGFVHPGLVHPGFVHPGFFHPHGALLGISPNADSVDVALGKRQLAVNHIAKAVGAGTGTAKYEGVPGALEPVKLY